MKFNNLIFAQDLRELKFTIEKIKKKISYRVVPLSLDTILYCDLKKIPYVDPKIFLNNDIHKKGIIFCDNLIKIIKKIHFYNETLNHQYQHIFRYTFNSSFLVIQFLKSINKKYKIKKIFV